jgi:nascent polypeptide-associated complex subunit alpha
MIPKLNPKQMESMMRRMGIKQVDVPANEVLIKTDDKLIRISNPSVTKVNMMGEETFQITGQISEEEQDTAPELSEEDIQTVVAQTNASPEQAKAVLEKNEGDIAKAILELKS